MTKSALRFRWFLWLSALAIAAVLLAGGWLYQQAASSLPDRNSAIVAAEGLRAPVQVSFDAAGRPWIQASSYGDGLFALGWAQARDRRWQMELLPRAGAGRLAELLGPDLFETDAAMIRAGVPALAAALERNADVRTLAWVDQFVAGVALADAQGAGSPEFLLLGAKPTPFTRSDVFHVGALMAFDSANNLDNELLRLALMNALGDRAALFLQGDRLAPDQPWVVPPAVVDADKALARHRQALEHPSKPRLATGSSAWAVSPARSESGYALMAFDSHDAWSMPSLLYEAHIFWGDAGSQRQLRGWTVAGLPGVINGFTDGGAWGLTNIGDSQDLVVETIRKQPDLEVLGDDGWYAPQITSVQVPVNGQPDRTVEIVHTRHGPLISMEPPLALMWSGHAHDQVSLEGLFALNRARNWEQASAAVDRLFAPSANLTWADVDGRIATRVHGRLPIRVRGEGLVPFNAAEGAANWTGFVPMGVLPRRVDPPQGFVAAANARTAPHGPRVSADNAPGDRARRIRALLELPGKLSVDQFRAMQMDFFDTQAARLLPLMLTGVDPQQVAPGVLAVLKAYAEEPQQDAASPGALVFAAWYQSLLEVLFAETLGDPLHRQLLRARYPTNHAVERVLRDEAWGEWWAGDRSARLTESLQAAVEKIVVEQGDDPARWRWDRAHQVKFPHQLGDVHPLLDALFSRGPWPWGGGNATLGRARYRYDRPYEARGGASMRMVVELSDPPVAHVVTAGGQSGHVLDAHYDDQFDAFLAGRLTRLDTRWTDRGNTIVLHPGSPQNAVNAR